MPPPELTMDYLGYALSTSGTPLVDRVVTLKVADTLATLGSTVTDAAGRWKFDDISPAEIVRAEISAGTTPQIAVKSVFSGDAYSLYIREKLGSAPAAIFNLPAIDNIYANGVPLAVALGPGLGPVLDSRYVSTSGDAIVGNLDITGNETISGTLVVGGAITGHGALTVDGGITTDGTLVVNGTGSFETLDVGGGPFIVGPDGALTATALATFGEVGASQLAITAGGQVRLPVNTTATPPIAGALDPNTGLRLPGSDQLQLIANGQEIARAWMNGATTQFASYATQTYIADQLLLGGTQVATAVANVVRVLQVRNAAGTALGYLPIYSGFSG